CASAVSGNWLQWYFYIW
nr:immunoglobulin heavy chain junction region [Macaca mulatta]MOW76592.1 immunoglobulin heavy chain junction region [Macaca mulatta]MOW77089.1 immunoglobulin heavy chain junction region [Macaca mulatta]MOW77151.1 immunoglobulin heavy chain junction region [Macaca mulatta]MOW77369.1 immunoglobulin heavy chain junction region [Macaca mulatta]